MTIINEIFAYYKIGFGRMFDFAKSSCRIELNCFILAYVALLICFLLVDPILVAILELLFKEQIDLITLCNSIVFFIFNAIHIFPLFTLVRRRLNDITPKKSKLMFTGLVIMYIIYISSPLLADVKTDVAYALLKLFTLMPYIVLSVACGVGVLVALIYLMSKKGNLNTAPLDSDLF